MEYIHKFYNCFKNCFKNCLETKKLINQKNRTVSIFNNDEGDLTWYSCFEKEEDLNLERCN